MSTCNFIVKEIKLHKKKDHSVLRKHPWVFSGAIASNTADFSNGDLVRVLNYKGDFLAVGHFQHATISVRILSFIDEELNQSFVSNRIKDAWDTRIQLRLLTSDNNVFRLIHGEGDSPVRESPDGWTECRRRRPAVTRPAMLRPV